jgi:hypothetical protein
MNDNHIIDVLDGSPLGQLDDAQLRLVRVHIEGCAGCARAYDAASLASNVIHERAVVAIEPPPFFATRVLAAVREQRSQNVPVMLRLWRSASILVSSMAVTTAALAVMSVVTPAPATETSSVSPYSAESVILNDEQDQLTYEQVLSTIYDDEEAR